MKAVTVRKIPPAIARVIDRRARELRTSVNKAVVSLLEEAAGMTGRKQERARHDDLDGLAGSWTREEAEAFDRSLEEIRGLDAEVWR